MNVTSKGRYALMVMIDLAQHRRLAQQFRRRAELGIDAAGRDGRALLPLHRAHPPGLLLRFAVADGLLGPGVVGRPTVRR